MNDRQTSVRYVSVAILATLLMLSFGNSAAEWSVPDGIQARLGDLTAEQQAFITSGAVIDFMSERQLEHEFRSRDADSLQALVADLLAVASEMGYNPERDMGAAPLNLSSERFNVQARLTPEPLRDLEREPGPFSVHRYLYPQSGVPTFGGARVAIWPEDLVAGNVDVAIVGVPSNMSSGRRDAGWGPDEMRALDTIAAPDVQSLVKPLEVLSVVDYGNFAINWISTELTVGHVTEMVAETAATGAVPMLVGGDTSMLYPGVAGVARHHGDGTFGLLHFSAHADAERHGDHTLSDRQAIFLLLDDDIVAGSDAIQVGLRGPSVDAETLQWLRDRDVRYHTMAEVDRRGADDMLRRVRREVERGPDAFFVSIDVSVLAPSDMAAAGRLTSGGLRVDDVIKLIRHVCAAKDIVGFEITDLAPMMDTSPVSVLHSNAVLNACLVGMAIRKAGLRPDYVHPLALDHGQR